MTPALGYAARSHKGNVRENNEDSAYAGPRLLALADGMGGHAAGEVASQYVVAALARLDEDQPPQDLTAALTEAMEAGNRAIAEHVEVNPETEGMGCTLTALLVDSRRVGLVHVGDSRAYLLRDGALTQITRDDTFVQSLVDSGELAAEDAHSHPRRSLILKALTGEPVEPTVTTRELRVGDRYLLCSDGLSDPVSTETIAETLSTGSPVDAADRLVSLALRSGGPDNVTVIVADVVDDPSLATTEPVVVGAASDEILDELGDDTAAGRAAAFSRSQAASRGGGAAAGAAVGRRGAASGGGSTVDDDDEEDAPPPSGSRWKFALSVLTVLAVVGGLVAASVLLARSNYFVAEADSQVVVKRGIPGDLLGMSLASVSKVVCLDDQSSVTLHDPGAIPAGCNVLVLGDLREPARETVRGGMPSGGLADANAQVSRLATENLLPPCAEIEEQQAERDRAERERVAREQAERERAERERARQERDARGTETPDEPTPTTEPSPTESPSPTPAPSRAAVPGENCRAVN